MIQGSLDNHEKEQDELQQIDNLIREERNEIRHDQEKLSHDLGELERLEERREALEDRQHDHHHGHHHHHPKLQCLQFIVNGTPQKVEVRTDWTLKQAVELALKESGNSGRPIDSWSVRMNNQVLDWNKKVEEFHFAECAELFLSLNAGQGGTRQPRLCR